MVMVTTEGKGTSLKLKVSINSLSFEKLAMIMKNGVNLPTPSAYGNVPQSNQQNFGNQEPK